jgi:RNA polymerase sigma factor (TIGR02999 family)
MPRWRDVAMPSHTIAHQLDAAADDPQANEELLRSVYGELRRMAHHFLGAERQQQTLQTTALVHEAYLKLVGQHDVTARGRAYFFAAAARAMRQVLVDAARSRRRDKRGGGERPASLDGIDPGDPHRAEEVLWVHHALDRLAKE